MLPTLNLPQELINHIFEFCIDKRLIWDKLIQQYLKGGFNRKNVKLNPYLKKEHWCAKKVWGSARPEISGEMTLWNSITRRREKCSFDYEHGGWNIKNKGVVVTFRTSGGFRNKWSAKEPVSKWLKNIKKFETSHPEYAKETYLPETPSPIKVKGLSKFYLDRLAKKKIKREREKVKKTASLFMEERMQLKLDECSFKKNHKVLLSFTVSAGELKFYKGYISHIYLHKHRGGNGYGLIFNAPRGKNRFDTLKIDNYIGEVKIMVRFEDGETRRYSNERLRERIQTSAREYVLAQDKIINDLKIKKITKGWTPDENIDLVDEDDNTCEKIMIDNIKYFAMSECMMDHFAEDPEVQGRIVLLNSKGELVGLYNKTTGKIIEAEWED